MLRRNAMGSIGSVLVLSLCLAAADAVGQTFVRGSGSRQATGGKPAGSVHRVSGKRTSSSKPGRTNAARSDRDGVANKSAAPQSSQAFADAVAIQAALDRAGYSPGVIDGLIGRKTISGLRAYQAAGKLPITGMADRETRLALSVDATPATTPYRLTPDDLAQVSECPKEWIAKSKAKMLGFQSLAEVAAYRGHCSQSLLARLNVGRNIKSLKPGDIVVIPNVADAKRLPAASRVEVDFASKNVRAFDATDRLIGLFHCSIAKETQHRPGGLCKVAAISRNPVYTFKPESWPEVKGIDRVLEIPPGARNPVGLCWIGLDKKGYGIHGTPEPEMIGKTGSHGCIRLTNWDVLRLAEMVNVGTEVKFVDGRGGELARVN